MENFRYFCTVPLERREAKAKISSGKDLNYGPV